MLKNCTDHNSHHQLKIIIALTGFRRSKSVFIAM